MNLFLFAELFKKLPYTSNNATIQFKQVRYCICEQFIRHFTIYLSNYSVCLRSLRLIAPLIIDTILFLTY